MTGTGDTVILHQELAYADVLPVSFRRLPGPLDATNAAAIAERNLRMLLASAALALPGVVAVVTAKDLVAAGVKALPHAAMFKRADGSGAV